MKNLLASIVFLLSGLSWAGEVTMSISGPDGLKGTATVINKVEKDGSKYVRLTMKLVYGDSQSSDVLQESSYSPTGEPIRMLQTSKSGSKKSSIVVTFTAEGAQVVTDKGDGPKANLILRPNGSISNPTEFWFCKDKPNRGQVEEFFMFRVSEQNWNKTKARFSGKSDIVVDGKKVTANLVQVGEIKSFLDEEGDPYRIELANIVLERTSKK